MSNVKDYAIHMGVPGEMFERFAQTEIKDIPYGAVYISLIKYLTILQESIKTVITHVDEQSSSFTQEEKEIWEITRKKITEDLDKMQTMIKKGNVDEAEIPLNTIHSEFAEFARNFSTKKGIGFFLFWALASITSALATYFAIKYHEKKKRKSH